MQFCGGEYSSSVSHPAAKHLRKQDNGNIFSRDFLPALIWYAATRRLGRIKPRLSSICSFSDNVSVPILDPRHSVSCVGRALNGNQYRMPLPIIPYLIALEDPADGGVISEHKKIPPVTGGCKLHKCGGRKLHTPPSLELSTSEMLTFGDN